MNHPVYTIYVQWKIQTLTVIKTKINEIKRIKIFHVQQYFILVAVAPLIISIVWKNGVSNFNLRRRAQR